MKKVKKVQRSVHLSEEINKLVSERTVIQDRSLSSVIEGLIVKALKYEDHLNKLAIAEAQEKPHQTEQQ